MSIFDFERLWHSPEVMTCRLAQHTYGFLRTASLGRRSGATRRHLMTFQVLRKFDQAIAEIASSRHRYDQDTPDARHFDRLFDAVVAMRHSIKRYGDVLPGSRQDDLEYTIPAGTANGLKLLLLDPDYVDYLPEGSIAISLRASLIEAKRPMRRPDGVQEAPLSAPPAASSPAP